MQYKITTKNKFSDIILTDEVHARITALQIVLGGHADKAYVTEYSMDGKPTGRWTRVQPGIVMNNY